MKQKKIWHKKNKFLLEWRERHSSASCNSWNAFVTRQAICGLNNDDGLSSNSLGSPLYYGYFILARIKTQSVISLLKAPLLYGHFVNTAGVLWPVADPSGLQTRSTEFHRLICTRARDAGYIAWFPSSIAWCLHVRVRRFPHSHAHLLRPRPYYSGGIWKRNSHSESPSNVFRPH